MSYKTSARTGDSKPRCTAWRNDTITPILAETRVFDVPTGIVRAMKKQYLPYMGGVFYEMMKSPQT